MPKEENSVHRFLTLCSITTVPFRLCIPQNERTDQLALPVLIRIILTSTGRYGGRFYQSISHRVRMTHSLTLHGVMKKVTILLSLRHSEPIKTILKHSEVLLN